MSSHSYIIAGFTASSAILNIICNTVFFITLLKTSSLHTPSNVLLGALCVTDLLAGVLCQPLFIALLLSNPGPCCIPLASAFYFIYDLSCWNSFICTLLITLDRYAAICHPYRYRALATYRKYIYSTLGIFALTTIHATIKFMNYKNTEVIFLSVDISLQLLIIMALLMMYCKIYRVVLSHRQRIVSIKDAFVKRQSRRISLRELTKTHTVTIILVVFICCYALRTIFDVKCILYYLGKIDYDLMLANWANFFVLLNSALNPIIYCARIEETRRAAMKMFIPNLLIDGRDSANAAANIQKQDCRGNANCA